MIEIPCPRCGKMRNFSHLPDVVEGDWRELLPELAKERCGACRMDAILDDMLAFVDPPMLVRWQTPLRQRR